MFQKHLLIVAALLVFSLLFETVAEARVRLEHICTVAGQQEIKLTGLGLVVGLNGTGDGGRNLPAMRALATALTRNNAAASPIELRDSKNVAIVMVEATIPRSGLRRGQKLDCYVSSTMGAKSLRGGRLLLAPLEAPSLGGQIAIGLASGPVYIEGFDSLATGKIPGGVTLEEDVLSYFIQQGPGGKYVNLLLDAAHSSFHSSSEVTRVINSEFSFEVGREIAVSTGPGVVEVSLPEQYVSDPVKFIAHLLDVGIDNPHTQARVVVNPKTGTVIVTGEVELSPVVITHRNLTVRVGQDTYAPVPDRFRAIDQKQELSPNLEQLVEALNLLRVPPEDVIEILRELNRSGKLHAEYLEY
ncbi:flagellar basal body P-ring protein FlgI [Calycomorphotria hydatis]|uniref:Flagellar P-ring protein n=1 Tax=Calycomorphotria hydatis TaxID=2528027 RepID=A0A517TCN8_9PLAN|nr:flagellar basal body P-ring protein FlgI [Calycomorphotria hydatis]QDT66132.1 Flagellar P-ring protein precursor [Calycomorphotria hydatis]